MDNEVESEIQARETEVDFCIDIIDAETTRILSRQNSNIPGIELMVNAFRDEFVRALKDHKKEIRNSYQGYYR